VDIAALRWLSNSDSGPARPSISTQTRTSGRVDMASSLHLARLDSAVRQSHLEPPEEKFQEHDDGACRDNSVTNSVSERKLPEGMPGFYDSLDAVKDASIQNTIHNCRLLNEGQEATHTLEHSGTNEGILERSNAQHTEDSAKTNQSGLAEIKSGEDIRDVINFDPTGFSSTPREPENLSINAKEALAELLENRGHMAGRPHRIPGTLAQSKVVRMLLDTGAASSLMPHELFLELKQFKPSLTLQSTRQTLHGVDGSRLRVYGIAVVDVEFAGQFVL